jgi:hypothetical protein
LEILKFPADEPSSGRFGEKNGGELEKLGEADCSGEFACSPIVVNPIELRTTSDQAFEKRDVVHAGHLPPIATGVHDAIEGLDLVITSCLCTFDLSGVDLSFFRARRLGANGGRNR